MYIRGQNTWDTAALTADLLIEDQRPKATTSMSGAAG